MYLLIINYIRSLDNYTVTLCQNELEALYNKTNVLLAS
uniref:Uncharacterized protein n=1 Tax=Myoviridae sp. ctqMr7 TaxID=2823552 RepID=A0A8S5LHR9_9CAUD|nr:MAG TPA: hypothetical protein [Myoviridae sp. ctqMr7]